MLGKYRKANNLLFLLILLCLSLLPVVALFHPGLPITHDGQDHVARIANFYKNLIEGNYFPVWAANLNWGYGHPILEFLYPLPSYIVSAFYLFGFGLVDSTKIVFGLGMVLSLFSMYLWLSQFTSKHAAVFGAVLYTYAPYRFVEVYVRGDIGENLAFVFLPLVLFFVYKLYKKPDLNWLALGSISLALLILAHNAVSLMSVPFILVYCALLIYLSKNRLRLAIRYLLLIVGGFALSAFFWVPALIEGKYTLRNIVTKGGYTGRFVTIPNIIYGPWNYGITGQFTVQYGLFQWLGILFSPLIVFLKPKLKEKYLLTIILLIFILFSTFLMLSMSGFIWSKIILLQSFQFPWRFLALIVFLTSVLGSLVFDAFPKKFSLILLIISVGIILIISSFYSKPKGYQFKPEGFYAGVYYSTTDTGESAPIWSVRFMEHPPKVPIEIIEGTGTVRELIRKSTYRFYSFDSKTNARVLVNTLYFPNWTIYIDGKKTPIIFQDPGFRGLMTFSTTKGQHRIEAVFKDTKLRAVSKIITLVMALTFFIAFALRVYKLKV